MEILMSKMVMMILGGVFEIRERTNQRAKKTHHSEDDMELDAEVLLNLEQDLAMQEDVAAEGLNITSLITSMITS